LSADGLGVTIAVVAGDPVQNPHQTALHGGQILGAQPEGLTEILTTHMVRALDAEPAGMAGDHPLRTGLSSGRTAGQEKPRGRSRVSSRSLGDKTVTRRRDDDVRIDNDAHTSPGGALGPNSPQLLDCHRRSRLIIELLPRLRLLFGQGVQHSDAPEPEVATEGLLHDLVLGATIAGREGPDRGHQPLIDLQDGGAARHSLKSTNRGG